ncbi:MAG: flagellar motor protein MotB [Candidatus Solibacter sp.]
MPVQGVRPIIIVRKKGGHAAHHGGAWKVAYADFVTAMMALFIVLWLMNSNAKVKEAVAGYFQDPAGTGKMAGTDKNGTDKTIEVSKDNMENLKHELEKAIKTLPKFQAMKDQISLTVTSEGLRIELMETQAGMFFHSGNANPTDTGVGLLRLLSDELGKLPNRLLIEGHTDATPYASNGPYTNWELSSDRANLARQLMQASGLRSGQVFQVRGFADQQLRNVKDPYDAANRRITVIVQYLVPPAGTAPAGQMAGIAPALANHKPLGAR